MSRIKRNIYPLLLIILLAVVLRVAVAIYYGDWLPANQDDQNYSSLALRLAQGHGYSFDRSWYPFTPAETPTAHWSFLYTAFVAAVYALVGFQPVAVRLAGAVLGGILLPWLAYRLARRVFPGNPPVALVTAACVAVYAFFILFAARIMTETFYIVALLWSLERAIALTERFRLREKVLARLILGLGVSLGLATLLRQAILPWIAVLFLWLLWVGYLQGQLRAAFTALVPAGVIIILFVLPFTVRNYLVYDDFLLLNSNSGYAMYSAQHPMHDTSFQMHAAAPLPDDLPATTPLNEAAWDRLLMQRGIEFVLAEPGRYLRLSLSRVASYFEFWPKDTSLLHNVGRLVSFTLFLPFMLYGIWLALRQAGPGRTRHSWLDFLTTPVALLLLFALFYSLLHIFTWAMPRYRLPVDAVLMPFAALALLRLTENWKQKTKNS